MFKKSSQRLARIVDGVVHSFLNLPANMQASDLLPPDDLSSYVEVPDEVEEGWHYDGSTFTKPAPSPEAIKQQPMKLSFLQFMDLFTGDEQLAIAGAAMTDVPTKLWYDRAVGAQFIDLGDERLAAGIQALVDAKLLTAARRTRVLKGLAPA